MKIQYRENCLSPKDFIRLRIAVGRVAIPLPQAEAALRTGLFSVTAFCEGKAVGMGRLWEMEPCTGTFRTWRYFRNIRDAGSEKQPGLHLNHPWTPAGGCKAGTDRV